jgi:hypothetical protein
VRATAWKKLGGTGLGTDGSLVLNDALGEATWTKSFAQTSYLQLGATLTYGSGLTFYLQHAITVN